ncbi:hypothetical protein [Faecalibacterium sp. 9]|uniref:hypothetical protein n=1 Tax=Faecalibacterium sp. 9 TaxID=3402018 RepID=UPI003AACAF55
MAAGILSAADATQWGNCLTQLTTALSDGGPEAMLQARRPDSLDLAAGITEQLPGLMNTGVETITQLAEDIVEGHRPRRTRPLKCRALAQGLVDNIPDPDRQRRPDDRRIYR